jgi:putative SOS response-associated peptidase YedK
MCGRFTQQQDPAERAEAFEAEPDESAVDLAGGRFNVAPTEDVHVVVEREERRRLSAYRWGLVPAWAPDPRVGSKHINARAETVLTSPAFRTAVRLRRCLVPASGFYEWRRNGDRRQPFFIRRRDGEPLAFAGLWSLWREPESEEWLRSCAIVTTTPNELMAELHDRMPVVLARDAWATWLSTDHADLGELRGLLAPCPASDLEAHPVSARVNDVRNEGPELVAPVVAEQPFEQAALFDS